MQRYETGAYPSYAKKIRMSTPILIFYVIKNYLVIESVQCVLYTLLIGLRELSRCHLTVKKR